VIHFHVVFGDLQEPLETLRREGSGGKKQRAVERSHLDSFFNGFLLLIFLNLLLSTILRGDNSPLLFILPSERSGVKKKEKKKEGERRGDFVISQEFLFLLVKHSDLCAIREIIQHRLSRFQ
jgi:hypothetical protein